MDGWDRANFKPDATDCQTPATFIWSLRLSVSSVLIPLPITSNPTFVRWVVIKAEQANQGVVYVGPSSHPDLRTTGFPLGAEEQLELPVNDLSIVYWQGDTVGDAIRVIYGT